MEEIPAFVLAGLPKKFRIEIVVDTELKAVDTQIFDATDNVKAGQKIVIGCDEFNKKIAEGFRLVERLRPRVPNSGYVVESS